MKALDIEISQAIAQANTVKEHLTHYDIQALCQSKARDIILASSLFQRLVDYVADSIFEGVNHEN